MENIYRLFQLLTNSCNYRRKNILLSWRYVYMDIVW